MIAINAIQKALSDRTNETASVREEKHLRQYFQSTVKSTLTIIHIYPSVGDRLYRSIAFSYFDVKMQLEHQKNIYTTQTNARNDTSDEQFLSNYFSFILINSREFNLKSNKWTNDVF